MTGRARRHDVARPTAGRRQRWDALLGGPGSEVDVSSFLSCALIGVNDEDAADDPTPGMGGLNGRPPRDAFWADDLTERRARFHAEDAKVDGPVTVLFASVPGRFATVLIAATALPDVEERAGADGAGARRRRAMAIRAAGAAGLDA